MCFFLLRMILASRLTAELLSFPPPKRIRCRVRVVCLMENLCCKCLKTMSCKRHVPSSFKAFRGTLNFDSINKINGDASWRENFKEALEVETLSVFTKISARSQSQFMNFSSLLRTSEENFRHKHSSMKYCKANQYFSSACKSSFSIINNKQLSTHKSPKRQG